MHSAWLADLYLKRMICFVWIQMLGKAVEICAMEAGKKAAHIEYVPNLQRRNRGETC